MKIYIAIQIIRTNAYSIIKYVFACRGVIDCHFSKKLIGLYFPEFTQIEFIIIWSPLRIQHQPISSIVKVPSTQVKIDNYIFRFKIYIKRRIGCFFRLLFSLPKLPHFKWICSEMMIHFFLLYFVYFAVAIELIVQHIRDFLNNRGRGIDSDATANTLYGHGKRLNESHSHNLHSLHWLYKIDVQNQWSQSIIILLSPQTIFWDTTRSLNNIEHGLIEIIYSI